MVTSNAPELNVFHRTLSRYVNSGCLSSRDKYMSLFSKSLPFRRNADHILGLFCEARTLAGPPGQVEQVIDIPVYAGENKCVHLMMEYLNEHLEKYLFGAYVHGSLGTYDEIAYSDFDAIVILSDSTFHSRRDLVRTATFLHNARRIMTDYDPLQHHGWFTLSEIALGSYPCSYFPPELFAFSKSLLVDKGRRLTIRALMGGKEYKDSFISLVQNVINYLLSSRRPRNVYQLKSLLSEFMLLPACYVQARDGVGIYKKYSFESASRDFTDDDWSIMKEVSSIRSNWHFKLGGARKRLITRNTVAGRLRAQRFAPSIPDDIEKILTEVFYQRMLVLAQAMRVAVIAL